MGKLLPAILGLAGLGAGIGGGVMLRPEPAEVVHMDPCGPSQEIAEMPADEAPDAGAVEYVKLNNQFVIPVVSDGRVSALVVMALSLEVSTGAQESVYQKEPKLRDAFLQVLFDHANSGGFDGAFTSGRNMTLLRNALLEVARQVLGSGVNDVLIVDVVRQDV